MLKSNFYQDPADDILKYFSQTTVSHIESWHFMLDIVSSEDNFQEKSNLYFWEEYEKMFRFVPYFYLPVTEINYQGK